MKKEKEEDSTLKSLLMIPLATVAVFGLIFLYFWIFDLSGQRDKKVFEEKYKAYMDEKETERKDLEKNFVDGSAAVYKITDKDIFTDHLVTDGLSLGRFNAPFIKVWDKQNDLVYWGEVTEKLYNRMAVGEELSVVVSEDQASVRLVDYNIVINQKQVTEE